MSDARLPAEASPNFFATAKGRPNTGRRRCTSSTRTRSALLVRRSTASARDPSGAGVPSCSSSVSGARGGYGPRAARCDRRHSVTEAPMPTITPVAHAVVSEATDLDSARDTLFFPLAYRRERGGNPVEQVAREQTGVRRNGGGHATRDRMGVQSPQHCAEGRGAAREQSGKDADRHITGAGGAERGHPGAVDERRLARRRDPRLSAAKR